MTNTVKISMAAMVSVIVVCLTIMLGGVGSANMVTPAESSNPVFLTTVVRFDKTSTGVACVAGSGSKPAPYIYHNSSHYTVGFTDVNVLANGDLELLADTNRPVGATLVGGDESMVRLGIFAGPSGGGIRTVYRFTYMSANGPVGIRADDPKLCGNGNNFWFLTVQNVPEAS